jgi:hypothetical protein
MVRFARPLACALSLFGASLHAQDDTLREAVQSFVDNPVQQQMMDDMLSADAMITQMHAMMPQLTEEQLQVVGRIGSEEMETLRPALEAAMVSAAVETFSLEEILALEAFYNTPEGASVMAKMQPYMASAMGAIGPEMQEAQMRIGTRLMTELSSQ